MLISDWSSDVCSSDLTTSPALPCDVIIVTAVKSLPSPFRLAMEQQALIMSFLNSYQFRYSTVLPCRSQIASPGGTRASRRAASSPGIHLLAVPPGLQIGRAAFRETG